MADIVAKKFLQKDFNSIWKEMKSINVANSATLASTINGVSGHDQESTCAKTILNGMSLLQTWILH